MANIKQQVKRILTSEKSKLANASFKSSVKSAIKAVEAAVEALKLVEIGDGLSINADYFNLDPNQIQVVFDTLFATESFEKLLPIAVNVATNIVASSEKVKEKLGL